MNKHIYLLLLGMLFGQSIFAHHIESLLYPEIIDGDEVIVFNKQVLIDNERAVFDEDAYEIKVSQVKNKNGMSITTDIVTLPYLADPGVIVAAFIQKIEGVNRLFILHEVKASYNASGLAYSSGYFMVNVFKKNHSVYLLDDGLSEFFGAGADVLDLTDKTGMRQAYLFPYKTQKAILDELKGSLFDQWSKGLIAEGKVLRKTSLQEVPNYIMEEKRYLIKNDDFRVKSISAHWLFVEYVGKGKAITGWIKCEDTNICAE